MDREKRLNQLIDELDRQAGWRKQELFLVATQIGESENASQRVALRSGIALLYAHWEGWVKATARSYLAFVNDLSVPVSQLTPCLRGTALKSSIQELEDSNMARVHTQFAERLRSDAMAKPQELSLDLIKANSNLSADLFMDIVHRVGAPPEYYALKKNQIDSLRTDRNKVAHGEYVAMSPEKFEELRKDITSCCEAFRRDICDLAEGEGYLDTPA